MRAVVQRVSRAKVTVAGEVTGEIAREFFVVLLGVADGDTQDDVICMCRRSSGCGCLKMPKAK